MAKVRTSNKNIPGFQLIAPAIWEFNPPCVYTPTCSVRKDIDAPSLILLCTWTGAQCRYIAKYTAEYRSLFPSTRIMVITTSAKDLCFRNSQRKQERLRPAVERISSYKYLTDHGMSNGILLHVFSEGGSNKACELAEAYYNITSTRLPVSALCCDSTPGHPRYLRLCNALNKSLPQIRVLRHTGLLFGSAVLGCIWILYVGVKGCENNVITRTRRRLQDPKHFDLTTPRCYLYSRNDDLIAWQDVQEHAEESMDQNIPVTQVLFEHSGHVGHAKQEPERYWNAVMATWRETGILEEKIPKLEIVVEEVDITSMTETVKKNNRWSDADSQRTLLPF
jgi:hypothetical protein